MKIQPDWLKTDPLQFVLMELYDGWAGASFCVGGCVRDAVMGLPCKDIDIATPRTPEEVEKLFTGWEHVKLIPTGVDHGTWTVVVDGASFEVTTFRKDVATDGRRATVAYAKTMKEDAQRRDFTMNALYMDWKGEVFDPTGHGLADLMARRIRFVGDADQRCKEDYLRIMRLFRFHAHMGVGPMDDEAYDAARNNVLGLGQVSGERIWSELKKMLSAHSPVEALYEMAGTGVLDFVLPNRKDVLSVAEIICAERDAGLDPKWERRYAALVGRDFTIPFPASNQEKDYIRALAENIRMGASIANTAYKTRDEDLAVDAYVWACGRGRVPCMPPMEELQRGLTARCPVTAAYLMDRGVPPGAELGALLKQADVMFIQSGLKATRDAIMNHLVLP